MITDDRRLRIDLDDARKRIIEDTDIIDRQRHTLTEQRDELAKQRRANRELLRQVRQLETDKLRLTCEVVRLEFALQSADVVMADVLRLIPEDSDAPAEVAA